jgi:hypothetical protein
MTDDVRRFFRPLRAQAALYEDVRIGERSLRSANRLTAALLPGVTFTEQGGG